VKTRKIYCNYRNKRCSQIRTLELAVLWSSLCHDSLYVDLPYTKKNLQTFLKIYRVLYFQCLRIPNTNTKGAEVANE